MEQSGLSSFCLNVVAGMAQSVGWLSMVTCQAHTMQPEVLVHVCLSVGELDVDATDAPLAPAAISFSRRCRHKFLLQFAQGGYRCHLAFWQSCRHCRLWNILSPLIRLWSQPRCLTSAWQRCKRRIHKLPRERRARMSACGSTSPAASLLALACEVGVSVPSSTSQRTVRLGIPNAAVSGT